MFRRTFFLAALICCAAAAPAHAATLPAASEPGVTVARTKTGSYAISFTAKAFKPLASHNVAITCTSAARRSPAAGPPRRFTLKIHTASRPAPVALFRSSGVDVCAFAVGKAEKALLVVALTPRGRTYIADARAVGRLETMLAVVVAVSDGKASWPRLDQLPQRARSSLVKLASPGAAAAAGKVGYFSDGGRRMTLATRSASGRRLSLSMDGAEQTSNFTAIETVFGSDDNPSGKLPVGPLPPAGSELPASTVPGVTASETGSDLALAFDPTTDSASTAFQPLAGRTIVVACLRSTLSTVGLALNTPADVFRLTAPAQPDVMHIDVTAGGTKPAHDYRTCGVGLAADAPLVQVAIGEAGRPALEEGLVVQALNAVTRRAAGDGLHGYASASELAGSTADAIAQLSSASDTPTDRRIGVYSHGDHLTVAARARTGRRLYVDVDGDVVRTNIPSVPLLIAPS